MGSPPSHSLRAYRRRSHTLLQHSINYFFRIMRRPQSVCYRRNVRELKSRPDSNMEDVTLTSLGEVDWGWVTGRTVSLEGSFDVGGFVSPYFPTKLGLRHSPASAGNSLLLSRSFPISSTFRTKKFCSFHFLFVGTPHIFFPKSFLFQDLRLQIRPGKAQALLCDMCAVFS